MTDRYVYYFKGLAGSADENTVSERPATLDAIEGVGEPIMESQLVVDHTQVDANGFLKVHFGMGSGAMNGPAAQIVSLELRARSRDREAANLNDSAESSKVKYMLSLESRELRKQARSLSTHVSGIFIHDRPESSWFEGHPDFE